MPSDPATTDGPGPRPDPDVAHLETEVAVTAAVGRIDVAVRGDLDAVTAATVRPALLAAIDQAATMGTGAVVRLDMAALDFLDSVGISVLVASQARAGEAGVSLELASVPASSRRVLEITRLTDVLTIVDPTG